MKFKVFYFSDFQFIRQIHSTSNKKNQMDLVRGQMGSDEVKWLNKNKHK